jgi:hypothetical protein
MSINDAENKHLKIMQAIRDCSATLQRLLDFSRRDTTRTSLPVDWLTSSIKHRNLASEVAVEVSNQRSSD